MSRSDKRVCRIANLLLPNKIKYTFIEKWLEHSFQATFGAFRLLLGGSTHVQLPLAKNEIYLTFSKSLKLLKSYFFI